MNYEETLSTLKAIQASYAPVPFLANPETEPRFVIDSDTREIIIPEEFKFLAVKMDHMSEKIYFEIPRYFDDEDLATKICVVQYINANGDAPIEAIVAAVDVDTESEYGKIIFRWDVDNYLTRYAGVVSFAVRFYTISDDNRFTYSWNTLPATLPVLDTLDNTNDTVSQNYPTELVQWQFRMSELDRTISDKIAEATENIDANVSAALNARQGAEDAETRVNAIVAGNEAYTKQQTHDIFALALRGTAEAAKSITIYPDKGSNVVATIHGFTKQEGEGDPSPVNKRPIVNGGINMVKLVLTGTENWTFNPSNSIYPNSCAVYLSASEMERYGIPKMAFGYSEYLKWNNSGYANDTPGVYAENIFAVRIDKDDLALYGYNGTSNTALSACKAYLTANPLPIWYIPVDEAQTTVLYAPLTGNGDGHTGACGELTAPLFQGDKLITKIKSGCDRRIVLTGNNVYSVTSDNAFFGDESGKKLTDTPSIGYGYAICERDYQFIKTTYWAGIPIGKFSVGNGLIGFRISSDKSKEEIVQEFNANPLIVWYRSSNYSEENDIPICFESHSKAKIILDGKENWGMRTDFQDHLFIVNAVPGCVSEPCVCDHYKGVKNSWGALKNNEIQTVSTGGYIGFVDSRYSTLEDAKSGLSSDPVTVIYSISTPIVYAHDPIDFIASPDEEGTWVITGEADGTVSAEYNKNITKALEDILTRVSALELHALGG